MTDHLATTGRKAIVFAAADDPQVTVLTTELSRIPIETFHASHIAHGLGVLCDDPPGIPRPTTVIILGPLSGLDTTAIAMAVRGLPGHAETPLIIAGEAPSGWRRCIAVADPATIRHLTMMDPESWPTAPHPVTTTPTTPSTGHAVTGKGIVLLVDDDEISRRMIGQVIRSGGHVVETCTDGRAALERIAAGGIALVLMDCQLPLMDGYEATRELRRRETGGGRRIPVIACTAHVQADGLERCHAAGMDEVLAKPMAAVDLLIAIRRWLITPPSTAPAPADADAVFDPGPLQRIEARSPGMRAEILGVVRDELRHLGDTLPRLLADGDLPAIAREAHRIKGSSGTFGARRLSRACAHLDRCARAGDAVACRLGIEAVRQSIAHLMERLEASGPADQRP